jgi:hypothetical protein
MKYPTTLITAALFCRTAAAGPEASLLFKAPRDNGSSFRAELDYS